MGISNPQAFSPAGSEITLSLLRNDFAFPVWSENSGFGCSRNVLWPGELGSSSFSSGAPPDEWVGRARMQISKTCCTEQTAHCNKHCTYFTHCQSQQIFFMSGHKKFLCETHMHEWVQICSWLHLHIRPGTYQGEFAEAHFREQTFVLWQRCWAGAWEPPRRGIEVGWACSSGRKICKICTNCNMCDFLDQELTPRWEQKYSCSL